MTTYYEHRQTGKRFTVVSATETELRLKGEHAEFTEPNNDAHFERMGYVKREGDPAADAPLAGGAAPAAAPAAPTATTPPAAPAVLST